MPKEAQSDLLSRARSDPEAFAEFFDLHFDTILKYAVRRTYDADVALDLTAEIFAQAFLGRRRYRGSSDREALGWLYGIARRQLASYFRRSKVEQRALRRLEIEVPRLSDEERARLDELANLDELRQLVRTELARLSPEQRDALRLRVIEELPYADVAKALMISEPAARARVSRGLKALARALDRSILEEAL